VLFIAFKFALEKQERTFLSRFLIMPAVAFQLI